MKPLKKAYGDCEGPFGFPMLSALAKEAENILKNSPADCQALGFKRLTTIVSAMDLKEGERCEVSLITTDSIDRDKEVILPGGLDWKQFQKNPVVTFGHKYNELPVGRCQWVKREKGKLDGWIAKTEYASKPSDWEGQWLPDAIFHLVKSKMLPGKSIGFIPCEMSCPEEKEIKARPELAGVQRIIRKAVILEYAVAPVQSNPDALVQCVAKAREDGLKISDSILEELGMIIPMGVLSLDEFAAEETSAQLQEFSKPYPNEHAARLEDPAKYERFARQNDKFGKGIHAIFGILKNGKTELQTIRFDKEKFSVEEAKKWLADHDYKPILFEPAEKKTLSLANAIKKIDVAAVVLETINRMRGKV